MKQLPDDPYRYAMHKAYRWFRPLVRRFPADVEQAVWLAVLQSDGTMKSIVREVSRQMRVLARELTNPVDPVIQYTVRAGYIRSLRDPAERPSKRAGRTGYRTDPERHRQARAKVSPGRRREIARMGAAKGRV